MSTQYEEELRRIKKHARADVAAGGRPPKGRLAVRSFRPPGRGIWHWELPTKP